MTYGSDLLARLGDRLHRSSPTGTGAPAPAANRERRRIVWRLLSLLSLLLAFGVFSNKAHADCSYDSGSASIITFAPPSTITVPTNTRVGSVLWTSAPITPSNKLVLDCYGTTTSGIMNSVAGQPTGDDTIFPTNISWLSYRILHPDTSSPLHATPNEPVDVGNQVSRIKFAVASALQLVVTGPITYSGQLSGQLGVWQMTYLSCPGFFCQSGTHPIATFTTSTVRFVVPACTVAVDPTVVTLPTVMASNFGGVNSTTGQTAFAVQLTCSASSKLSITLATRAAARGVSGTGVIAPTSGPKMAQGIGVQILDNSSQPITFEKAIPAGTTSSGAFSIPFYARYYQTATPVSGGQVSATATYTLTYQ